MTKRITCLIIAALLLLTGCSKSKAALPAPAELYKAISEAVALPEMVRLPPEELSGYLGIEEREYAAAAVYGNLDSLRPDEVIIIQAVSGDAAEAIRQKLEAHLEYKTKSAENYLPENIPVLEKAVIRQDGLTISLLVSEQVDEILKVYGSY